VIIDVQLPINCPVQVIRRSRFNGADSTFERDQRSWWSGGHLTASHSIVGDQPRTHLRGTSKYRADARLYASSVERHYGPMTVKDELPHPYNLDLSDVLRNVDRRTASGRRRIANDLVTAGFLAAGMRLLDRRLGPSHAAVDCSAVSTAASPLLRILSQRAVCDEMSNNQYPFARVGRTSTLRSTWATQGDYAADLVRFALWNEHYSGVRPEELVKYHDLLVHGADFVTAIHAVADTILLSHIGQPRWRLQLIATATAEADDAVAGALMDNYKRLTDTFMMLFGEALKAHSLTLRPGVSLANMVHLLMAAAEGLALRAISDTDLPVWNEDRSENLLGTSAVSFLMSCAQPLAEKPQSLNDAIRNTLLAP
jgi:hypothetical protein